MNDDNVKWNRVYVAVVAWLVVQIVLYYMFMKYFS